MQGRRPKTGCKIVILQAENFAIDLKTTLIAKQYFSTFDKIFFSLG